MTEDAANNADLGAEELSEELLTLLGNNVLKKPELGTPLQKDLAERWMGIMKSGLTEEERACILNKYPPPSNCLLLQAAKLNQMVATAVSESVKRRDSRLEHLQKQIGASLTAIGDVLYSLLREEGGGENRHHCIKAFSDAGRLLTDVHHSETTSRRELVSYNLNRDLKNTLNEAPLDEWLFGSDLDQRLKATKDLERASSELKPAKPKQMRKSVPKNLNFRDPSQAVYQGVRQSGHRQPRRAPYHQRTNLNEGERVTIGKIRWGRISAARQRCDTANE